MSLLQLPDELLCHIGGYLNCYRDFRALILSNRRLNRIFEVVPASNLPNCRHGSPLVCAAQSGDIGLVLEILSVLKLKKKRYQTTSATDEQPIPNTQEDSTDEEEERARNWCGQPYSDHKLHPLWMRGYRLRDILNIQRAFLAAISTGSIQLVQCLLDCGAVARFRFPHNEQYPEPSIRGMHSPPRPPTHPPPVYLAIRHGNDALFDLLIENNVETCGEPCPLAEAVTHNRCHAVRILLKSGECGHWWSALSSTLDNRAMFDFLVANGVTIRKYGHLALYKAIHDGRKEWVEFLISEGANPSFSLPTEDLTVQRTKCYSSIYHAILHGHVEICKILLDCGVRPEKDDLQLAREKGYDEIVGILSAFPHMNVRAEDDIFDDMMRTLTGYR